MDNKYTIQLSPYMTILDNDIMIKWKNIKEAFFKKYKKKIYQTRLKKSDIVIWTWTKRLWFNLCD